MSRIKFNVDEWLPRLSQVVGVVNSKNPLPILGDILIKTDMEAQRGLTFTASDSETWLTIEAPHLSFDDSFEICIAAVDFYKALCNLKGKQVCMTLDAEHHTVECDYGNGRFTMAYEDATEYPKPNMDASDSKSKVIDADKLLYAVNKPDYATANDELRPVMNGIRLEFFADGMVAVASDGHKLAKFKDLSIIPEGDNVEVCGFTLPKKPAGVLRNLLNQFGGDVSITFNDRCATFVIADCFTLNTRLIEGRYPNYESVIPRENTIVATIDKAAFLAAMKRVLPMSNASSELISFKFTMGNMEISAEDYDFSRTASENISCDYASPDLQIGFKGSVIMAVLQSIDDDSVKVYLKDSMRAGVFMPATQKDNTSYLALAMPMLIQDK